ncbi:hypothetical protein ACQ33O_05020 [Ferruginibacter sp. SUN002]|uniref:hypothetical protein n=1 Tax=Ferruginibacter sp. SUN002 TaxID=2937789 RepID=UPI003D36D4F5
MKKTAIFLSLLALLMSASVSSKAQGGYYFFDNDYYDTDWIYELGGSLGGMNCLTDLGGHKGIGKPFLKDLNFGNNRFAMSGYLSALYKNKIAIRLEGTFGTVKAYDSVLYPIRDNSGMRYWRGLHFRSKISEISLIAEIHPTYIFIDWASRDREPPRISPYILAGVGYYHFNPQAQNSAGQWVDLQPLSTEGQGFAEYPQRKKYKLNQISFPVGIGVKYELSSVFNLRAEIAPRILRTDYLDDVSTRYIDPALYANYFAGNRLDNAKELNDRRAEVLNNPVYINPKGGQIRGDPRDKDAFFTFMLKLGITFGRERIN